MYARVAQDNAKFSNVDVIEFMEKIVLKHVQHYQSDFDIDKEILRDAAGKQEQQERELFPEGKPDTFLAMFKLNYKGDYRYENY